MNKNLKEKMNNVFKKEGFYIVLFLSLCILVMLGSISYKMLSNRDKNITGTELENEITSNVDDESREKNITSVEMPNAERVEEDTQTEEKEEKEESKIVSNNNINEFINPVEGIEIRTYTYPKPVQVEENVFRSIRGINIETEIGTQVKAASDGVVSLVGNSGVEEGVVIEIKHSNGLRTRYGNLDEETLVKEGETVSAGKIIGRVGNTAKVFSEEEFGEFLNLQVIDSYGNQVNPEKYFKFKSE